MDPGAPSADPAAPHFARNLALLALLSLALRLAWLLTGPKVIEPEGVYYARVAENLAAGRGFVSLHEMGKHLLYPPLYATMISVGVRLGASSEGTARGISLVFGAVFPLLVALFTRRLYGDRAGWGAGLLAAVQPVLIVASAAVLTESTYLTLSLAAIWCATELFSLRGRGPAVAGGIFLGLSYLLRPEAFILAFLFAAATLVVNRDRLRLAAARVGLLLAVFALFAIPYIHFLYRETGQVRFEAKTADGVRYAQRAAAGQGWGEIYFAIDKDTLIEKGATNTSDLEMLQKTHATMGERARMLARQGVHNFPRLVKALWDWQLGQPVFGLFVLLGIFSAKWDAARRRRDLALLIAAGLTLLTFCTWPFFHDRFLFPLLPAGLVWGGVGFERLARWLRGRAERAGMGAAPANAGVVAVLGLALVGLCAAGAYGVRDSDELSQGWMVPSFRDDVAIGRWLGTQGTHLRVMDTGPLVAFYSGAVLVPYPWCDAETALRYIPFRKVDYLVIRDVDVRRRPYLRAWVAKAPAAFQLVQTFPSADGFARLYRYSPGAAPE